MSATTLPEGWSYEEAEVGGKRCTRARCAAGRATFWVAGDDDAARAAAADIAHNLDAAIRDGLLGARPPAGVDRPGQLDMFAGLPPAQLVEDEHAACPTHGRFYQPHCWHCKRRRSDRPHKRARQS